MKILIVSLKVIIHKALYAIYKKTKSEKLKKYLLRSAKNNIKDIQEIKNKRVS